MTSKHRSCVLFQEPNILFVYVVLRFYLFIYLFNFANRHLQGEHTKTYMDIWQETRYSFCHLQRPLQKDTISSK